ncbi:uncharacterized protein LOC657010 [Tribolium castaneum]|uniref:Uncharacterized protein n=1 Tax=Tribolium castaneum TaxID=7070 RepID=D6WF62_TRICA|nr:PREDICTED: uncharacterized protein LOC657010 [Tribolium castaneum]EEZ99837.1 hypothetical protein TcasGA2_TC002618 [Tribolium castaneum]|eukprot:XP_968592.2 PREDICTED: uncharacterized protein LOC657010 [Tribolium castaneum]
MAKRVNKNHYIASPRHSISPTPVHVSRSSAYSDGEESQRAPSERTLSEYTSVPYTIVNERNGRSKYHNGVNNHPPRAASVMSRGSGYDNGSDIYVTSGAYKAPSEISRSSRARAPSHYSYRSGRAPSLTSTVKTRTSRKGGVKVETMAAPNPFCPNIKGMCCLMLLLNLGIILITLGFVIVIQFFEPIYVWVLGIVFLIFGFLTLIGSLIYCVIICKDVKSPKDINPEDLYWTHHWQKTIGSPEINYKTEEKYDDRYSDRYSISKLSGKYSDRNSRY